MAPVDVRKMQWYGKWRASVFKTIDQCFDFDASSVELYGVLGDETHEVMTAEEFPCLMQDLQEAYKNNRMQGGGYNKVNQGRVAIEKLERKLLHLDDGEFAVLASCPATKFDETKAIVKAVNKKVGNRVFMAWAQKGDAADGTFTRDTAAGARSHGDALPNVSSLTLSSSSSPAAIAALVGGHSTAKAAVEAGVDRGRL